MEKAIKKIGLTILALSLVLVQDFNANVMATQKNLIIAQSSRRPGRPRKGTAGGGSRPVEKDCLSKQPIKLKTLKALSPSNDIGLTEKEYPNLFVHIPQTSAKMAEFSLFDSQMRGVYQANIPVNGFGLQSINLTSKKASLVKNKPYYWTYALICNESDRTQDWVVGGWVERRELSKNLQTQLFNSTGTKRVYLYARNGFWYEALSTLVELQFDKVNNDTVTEMWKILLKSAGINDALISITANQISASKI